MLDFLWIANRHYSSKLLIFWENRVFALWRQDLIDSIAINCLAFEKIAFSHFGDRQTDRQADRQTNRWTGPLHEAVLTIASGGLKIKIRNNLVYPEYLPENPRLRMILLRMILMRILLTVHKFVLQNRSIALTGTGDEHMALWSCQRMSQVQDDSFL